MLWSMMWPAQIFIVLLFPRNEVEMFTYSKMKWKLVLYFLLFFSLITLDSSIPWIDIIQANMTRKKKKLYYLLLIVLHSKFFWDGFLSQYLFAQAWAVYKGKYKEGRDRADPTMWKTRLRCALNKSTDFQEVPERNQLDITEPYKVYRIEQDVCLSKLGGKKTQIISLGQTDFVFSVLFSEFKLLCLVSLVLATSLSHSTSSDKICVQAGEVISKKPWLSRKSGKMRNTLIQKTRQ